MTIVEYAPAKLNLGLRIVGRRRDGYHLIESVMVPVSLCDRVRVSVDPRGPAGVCFQMSRAARGIPRGACNLAARAAQAFLEAAGGAGRIAVELEKKIPAAAGLGGGSSDAGAVLRALRALWPGRVSPAELHRLAGLLGADVPFFLRCRPARVSGIGEIIRPFRGVVPGWFVVAVPRRGVSTAAAYGQVRLTRSQARSTVPRFRYSVSVSVNDLEAAVIPRRPDIARLKRELGSAGARTALMSGSGSAVFGTFATRGAASAAASRLPHTVRVFVVRPLAMPPAPVRRPAGRSPSW